MLSYVKYSYVTFVKILWNNEYEKSVFYYIYITHLFITIFNVF